jgi:hypothetical protein
MKILNGQGGPFNIFIEPSIVYFSHADILNPGGNPSSHHVSITFRAFCAGDDE